MAGGMPVVVPCDFGGFADFGMKGAGGFGCPTVFLGFDLLFGLASLDLRRVSKAFARKLAVFAKSLMSSTACLLLVLLAPFSITSISLRISSLASSMVEFPYASILSGSRHIWWACLAIA